MRWVSPRTKVDIVNSPGLLWHVLRMRNWSLECSAGCCWWVCKDFQSQQVAYNSTSCCSTRFHLKKQVRRNSAVSGSFMPQACIWWSPFVTKFVCLFCCQHYRSALMKCYEVACNDIISSKDLFKQQVLVPGYDISYLDATSVVVPT